MVASVNPLIRLAAFGIGKPCGLLVTWMTLTDVFFVNGDEIGIFV